MDQGHESQSATQRRTEAAMGRGETKENRGEEEVERGMGEERGVKEKEG